MNLDARNALIGLLLGALGLTVAVAQPTTTKPDVSNTLTQCAVDKVVLGGGVGSAPVCSTAFSSAQILVGQSSAAPLPRTMSGDATISSAGAVTLASTITAGGPTGSATAIPVITYDAKGRLTAVTTATPNNSSTTGPTTQLLLSGTDATYTTPANVKWIEVFMVGGGAGGLGSGDTSAATAPTAGGATCWKASGTACSTPLYQASGGGIPARSATPATGGAGGGVAGSATCNDSTTGGGGHGGGNGNSAGGTGGNSVMGGGAPGAVGAGTAATANTGGGGGGGGTNNSTLVWGAGGGAGGYCRFVIANPAGTYVYTIGAAGSAGASGSGGLAGGNGGTGRIFVREHYNY